MLDDFKEPWLTMPQLLKASAADRVTLENWMRFGHVVPALDLPGKDRRFSLADLVRVEVIWTLREVFQLKVEVAAEIATRAVDEYSYRAIGDAKAVIFEDLAPGRSSYRSQFSLMRMPDGALRIVAAGDVPAELGVDLIVPVGLCANYCFSRLKPVVEQILEERREE